MRGTSVTVPARNVRELIALGQKDPGQLTLRVVGQRAVPDGRALYEHGADRHGARAVQRRRAGAPRAAGRGSGAVIFHCGVFIAARDERALARLAVTSAKRTPAAPDFPTVAESGLPGYEAVSWYGLFAPAGTPRDIVVRLNAETVRALKLPDVRQLMLAQGAEPVSDSPEQFAALVRTDIAKWGEVVRKSGAKAD